MAATAARHAGSDTGSFIIVVRDANTSPQLPLATRSDGRRGPVVAFLCGATDPDGDPLIYHSRQSARWSHARSGDRESAWTPGMHQAGLYEDIEVIVTDGHRSRFDTFDILVANVNQAPQIVPQAPLFLREAQQFSINIEAGDADGDPLVFSVAGLPSGAPFNELTGILVWTPHYEQAGDHQLTFTVTDPDGLSDSMDVTLRVDNVNRPPLVDTSYHAVQLGDELRFLVEAIGPRSWDHVLLCRQRPAGRRDVDPDTGEFVWTPGPGQAGEYTVGLACQRRSDNLRRPS